MRRHMWHPSYGVLGILVLWLGLLCVSVIVPLFTCRARLKIVAQDAARSLIMPEILGCFLLPGEQSPQAAGLTGRAVDQ